MSTSSDNDGRVFVVGDIHGCPDELRVLIRDLALRPEDEVVFVGDYVDRGPGSKEVVEFLLDLRRSGEARTVFLKGNHEDMFLDHIAYPGRYGEVFLLNGGTATLRSYGLAPDTAGREVAALLPEGHLDFFLNLELFHTAGDALCVHAGVNPTRSLEAQDEEDLLWIRGEFILHSHGLPWTVVFGHTPQRRVLFDLPYKIGIDTGLVYGGMLSCIELREKKLYQVARNGGRATVTDVSEMW